MTAHFAKKDDFKAFTRSEGIISLREHLMAIGIQAFVSARADERGFRTQSFNAFKPSSLRGTKRTTDKVKEKNEAKFVSRSFLFTS